MKIKEVATLCGISTKSIRYYEDMGLLDIGRGDNGYREFSEQQIQRIKEICLFRSLDMSIEDIRRYYEEALDLDAFLGIQMEKQQEKIFVLEENKQFMLKLQQHLKKQKLHEAYEERRQQKGFRNDQQELEKQYYAKTKRGKQWFLILLVWVLTIGFLFELSMAFDGESFLTFAWIALGLIIFAAVLTILLWFWFPAHGYVLRAVAVLATIEELPEYLDKKMERVIPCYWVRKVVTFLMAFVAWIGPVALVCWILSVLF